MLATLMLTIFHRNLQYTELCSAIHGAPWSGPGVAINVQNVNDGGASGVSAKLLLKIAEILKLPLAIA